MSQPTHQQDDTGGPYQGPPPPYSRIVSLPVRTGGDIQFRSFHVNYETRCPLHGWFCPYPPSSIHFTYPAQYHNDLQFYTPVFSHPISAGYFVHTQGRFYLCPPPPYSPYNLSHHSSHLNEARSPMSVLSHHIRVARPAGTRSDTNYVPPRNPSLYWSKTHPSLSAPPSPLRIPRRAIHPHERYHPYHTRPSRPIYSIQVRGHRGESRSSVRLTSHPPSDPGGEVRAPIVPWEILQDVDARNLINIITGLLEQTWTPHKIPPEFSGHVRIPPPTAPSPIKETPFSKEQAGGANQLGARTSLASIDDAHSEDGPTQTQALLPLRIFVHELLRRSRAPERIVQRAVYYLERIRTIVPKLFLSRQHQASLRTDRGIFHPPSLPHPLLCPRRAFLAALMAACKYTQEEWASSQGWGSLVGLPAKEVSRTERALLDALDWRLSIPHLDGSSTSSRSPPPTPALTVTNGSQDDDGGGTGKECKSN